MLLRQLRTGTGSLSCLEGYVEMRVIQHANLPKDVTKLYTLNLYVKV